MSIISPLAPPPVSHQDLVRFGLDMTANQKTASQDSKPQNSRIESMLSTLYIIPEIISLVSDDIIEIFKKYKNKNKTIKVSRKTGYIIEKPEEEFTYISKFDPETFPEKSIESIHNVGYWNKLNQYIKAK